MDSRCQVVPELLASEFGDHEMFVLIVFGCCGCCFSTVGVIETGFSQKELPEPGPVSSYSYPIAVFPERGCLDPKGVF